MWACPVQILASKSNRVGGVSSRSTGDRIKKLILFSESGAKITLNDNVWACLVEVLSSRSNRVGGVSSRSTGGRIKNEYFFRNLWPKLPKMTFSGPL